MYNFQQTKQNKTEWNRIKNETKETTAITIHYRCSLTFVWAFFWGAGEVTRRLTFNCRHQRNWSLDRRKFPEQYHRHTHAHIRTFTFTRAFNCIHAYHSIMYREPHSSSSIPSIRCYPCFPVSLLPRYYPALEYKVRVSNSSSLLVCLRHHLRALTCNTNKTFLFFFKWIVIVLWRVLLLVLLRFVSISFLCSFVFLLISRTPNTFP